MYLATEVSEGYMVCKSHSEAARTRITHGGDGDEEHYLYTFDGIKKMFRASICNVFWLDEKGLILYVIAHCYIH